MSKELFPNNPLFVVVSSYGTHNVAMRQPNGSYTPVCKMQMPYDNIDAALGIAQSLEEKGNKLKMVKAKPRKPTFVGVTT